MDELEIARDKVLNDIVQALLFPYRDLGDVDPAVDLAETRDDASDALAIVGEKLKRSGAVRRRSSTASRTSRGLPVAITPLRSNPPM